MKKGILYINFTKDAPGIADAHVITEILKNYKLVENNISNKQFNISNFNVFFAISVLCMQHKIIAEKIVYMNEGQELKMKYEKYGVSDVNTPRVPDEIPDKNLEWLNYFLGI